MIKSESSSLNHIIDTTGGTNDDMNAILKSADVVPNSSTTNASVDADVHEVTKGHDDFDDLLSKLTSWSKDQSLAIADSDIQSLENPDGEGGSLPGSCKE
jgi:hypothetical protein